MSKEPVIVFVGSRGCGKSTLVKACSSSLPMILVDTDIEDTSRTQEQIKQSDLIVIMADLDREIDFREIKNYYKNWLKTLNSLQPVILALNKMDKVAQEKQDEISKKWKKFFLYDVWESHCFVSAKTGEGVENMIELFFSVLENCSNYPRAVLIDTYNNRLKPNFVAALTRIFGLLDSEGVGVLGFSELKILHEEIWGIEFTGDTYNTLLSQLNEKSTDYVRLQGTTQTGFMYMMQRLTRHKQWRRCWITLQYFDYDYDLTLKPQPGLSLRKLQDGECVELLPQALYSLEQLFDKFSKEKIFFISLEEIKLMFSVFPQGEEVPLYSPKLFSIFERDMSSSSCYLTRDGWLSYWVFVTAEWPERTLRHLSYLIKTRSQDAHNKWFRVCKPKDRWDDTCDRILINALVMGDEGTGKREFTKQLISRQRSTKRSLRQEATGRMFCNRVQGDTPKYYRFLCLTEVQSNNLEYVKNKLLPNYDLIILVYDLKSPSSFKVMIDLYDFIQANNVANLPIQVLALKTDTGVTQETTELFPRKLKDLGLLPQLEVWLSCGEADNNTNFEELFNRLLTLGQKPVGGRVRTKKSYFNMSRAKVSFMIPLSMLAMYGIYYFYYRTEGAKSTTKEFATGKNGQPKDVTRRKFVFPSSLNLVMKQTLEPKIMILTDLVNDCAIFAMKATSTSRDFLKSSFRI